MTQPSDIVRVARSWIGTPYRHQASLKGVGTDCLGLVRGVWRETLGEEPEAAPAYSPGWAEAGDGETLAEAARRHMLQVQCTDFHAGDLLLFRWREHLPAKHAGIATNTIESDHSVSSRPSDVIAGFIPATHRAECLIHGTAAQWVAGTSPAMTELKWQDAADPARATHMVHAQEDACVTEIHLSSWWRRHLAFAFRFPGSE